MLETYFVLLLFLLFDRSLGVVDDGTCSIDVTDDQWIGGLDLPLNDNQVNVIIKNITYNGTIENPQINGKSLNDKELLQYFNVSMDPESHLIILETTKYMAKFDENTPTSTKPIHDVINCLIACESASPRQLQLYFNIKDFNQHKPNFDKPNGYSFKVPVPLIAVEPTTFSHFGSVITVTDIDFTNDNVDFSIEPDEDFSITTKLNGNKTYTAMFTIKRILQWSGLKNYTITVTDRGKLPGTLSSTTQVTFEADESQSPDNLSFEQVSYAFNYSLNSGQSELKPNGNKIKLQTNKPESVTTESFKIDGDLKEYLTIREYEKTSQTITLETKEIKSDAAILTSILTATTDGVRQAVTTLLVYMPEASVEFDANSYKAVYIRKTQTIEMDNYIKVTCTGGKPRVHLDGEYSDYFDVKENSNSSGYIVEAKPEINLPTNISVITPSIIATLKDKTAKSILIMNVQSDITLEFTNSLYTANYGMNPLSVNIDDNNPIEFKNDEEPSDIFFENISNLVIKEYLEINNDTKHYKIKVNKALPDKYLQKSSLALKITAVKDNTPTSTNFILNMPQMVKEPNIKFSDVLFIGDYNVKEGKLSEIDLRVETKEKDDNIKCCEIESEFIEYFQATYKSKIIYLQLKNGRIPEDKFENVSTILMKITASIKDTTDKATTVININIEGASTRDDSDTNSTNVTAYVVVISILVVLIIALIIGSTIFYCKKIRNHVQTTIIAGETKPIVTFDKDVKDSEWKKSSISDRRPTGFVASTNLPEDYDDDSITKVPISEPQGEPEDTYINANSVNSEMRTRKKSVIFDDNVEKLQIESNEEDSKDENIYNEPKQNAESNSSSSSIV